MQKKIIYFNTFNKWNMFPHTQNQASGPMLISGTRQTAMQVAYAINLKKIYIAFSRPMFTFAALHSYPFI